jgi:hypothetical protein
VEGDPGTPFGVIVEGHLQGAVLMGHGKAAGEMTTELGEGCEKEPGGLPEAVGEGPGAFLLRGGRGKGSPRGGVMTGGHSLPRGTPRIA